MREIKFRVVWNNEVSNEAFTVGEFTEGVEMSFKDGGTLPFKDIDWATDTVAYLQYTGLKDKNGKEIYEGDVVKTMWQHDGITNYDYEFIGVVVWCDVALQWQLRKTQTEIFPTYYPLVSFEREEIDTEVTEVIGNIYENPELIKS